MSSKKRVDLVAYFLRSSPASQCRLITRFAPSEVQAHIPPPPIPSDEDYLCDFFDRLEAVGPSTANFATYKHRAGRGAGHMPNFRKMFPSVMVMRLPHEQPQSYELSDAIKAVSSYMGDGTILFQELQQRLQMATPTMIGEARTKLIYLFKLLINRRDKIHNGSLVLQANLQLSRAIIDALSRAQQGATKENWRQLEAMEKLLRAREYHKKGLRDIALSNFEEIFRDGAASNKTRMEALKVLCSSGEQLRDPSILERLMSETQARGQKEFEEILLVTIRKIKSLKQ